MGQFQLFKKVAPAAMMFIAPKALAGLDFTMCESSNSKFALEFNEVSFRPGRYAFFDYSRINGVEYYGGQGSMAGIGQITQSVLKLELTWTQTGSRNSNKIGLLTGVKGDNSQWLLKIAPWNSQTQSYDTKNLIELRHCSTRTL